MATKLRRSAKRIKFPPEDRSWIELQERVISITGRLIEDLTPGDETALLPVLSKSEKSALQNYRDRKNYELARPNVEWKEKKCDLTLGDIQDFTDCVRALTSRLKNIYNHPHLQASYADVLERIAREFDSVFARFPGAENEDSARKDGLSSYLICQAGRLPAVDESIEILEDAYDLLDSREQELIKKQNDSAA
jgi:hypothetical protein